MKTITVICLIILGYFAYQSYHNHQLDTQRQQCYNNVQAGNYVDYQRCSIRYSE